MLLSDTNIVFTHLLLLTRMVYGKWGANRDDADVRGVLEDGSRCCDISLWNPNFGLGLVASLPSLCILLTHAVVFKLGLSMSAGVIYEDWGDL